MWLDKWLSTVHHTSILKPFRMCFLESFVPTLLPSPAHTFILPKHDQVLEMVHTNYERCHCRRAFAWEGVVDDKLRVVTSPLTSALVTPAPSDPPTITCYSSCNHRKEIGPNLFGGLAAGRGRGCIFCSFRSCISFPWFLMLSKNDSQVPVWKPFWNKMQRPSVTILLASQQTRINTMNVNSILRSLTLKPQRCSLLVAQNSENEAKNRFRLKHHSISFYTTWNLCMH